MSRLLFTGRGLDGLGKATSISASQQNGIETETTSFSYTKVSSDTGHTNGTIPADEVCLFFLP